MLQRGQMMQLIVAVAVDMDNLVYFARQTLGKILVIQLGSSKQVQ